MRNLAPSRLPLAAQVWPSCDLVFVKKTQLPLGKVAKPRLGAGLWLPSVPGEWVFTRCAWLFLLQGLTWEAYSKKLARATPLMLGTITPTSSRLGSLLCGSC